MKELLADLDARTAFASAERFPEADEALRAWPDAVFGERTLDAYLYEEIALAILAEMLAVRHGREGGPLSGRRAPIYGDG